MEFRNFNSVALGYAELVKRYDERWNWFGHFTFPEDIHPEAAGKIWKKFTHMINRDVYGCRYYKRDKGIIWSRGSEYQKRGVIHYHSLLGDIPDRVRRLDYLDLWQSLAGFARIFKYERGKGAEEYITKSAYAFKRGEVDFSNTLAVQLNSNQLELSCLVAMH